VNKTRQVTSTVLRMILDGTHGPGDRLPTEREMASHSGLSRVTVRRAYGELASAGVLTRRQGDGTHIATAVRGCTDDIREVALLTAGMGSFGLAFLRAIESKAAAMGALLVVRLSEGRPEREGPAAVDLVAKAVRNLVVWPGGEGYDRATFQRLRVVGTNMVFFDRIRPGDIADFVGLDNRHAIGLLLRHAAAAGCRCLQLVRYAGNVADSERERCEAFMRGCAKAGVRSRILVVPWGTGLTEALVKARHEGLGGEGPETAIFCVHDALALRVAEIVGRQSPVYGVDGAPEAIAAGIVTVRQPLVRMAGLALKLLREQQAKGAEWRAREIRCRGRLVPGRASP
jgi:DNA-binding LacI/PurR family transcriptional regulator